MRASLVVAAVLMAGCSGTGGTGAGGGSATGGGSSGSGGGIVGTGGGSTSTGGGAAGGGGSAAGGGTAGTGGGTTGTGGGSSGFSLASPFGAQTQESAMAVDGTGRIHLVGLAFDAGTFIYATCASHCGQTANWQRTSFTPTVDVGNDQSFVLRVTSDGRPRLMVRQLGKLTRYACEGSCLTASSWKALDVAPSASLTYTEHAYYAIGSGGQEAAVYPPTLGSNTFTLSSCAGSCDQAASWQQTTLPWTGRVWTDINVAITSTGAIGIAANDSTNTVNLAWGQCLSSCTSAASWSSLLLLEGTTGNYVHALGVSPQGLPRIAVISDGTDSRVANTLRLLSCDSNCATLSSWQVLTLGPQSGSVDAKRLWLDYGGAGPILAWRDANEVDVGRCSSNCEHAPAGWSLGAVGSSAAMLTTVPSGCTSSVYRFLNTNLNVAPVGSGYALMVGLTGLGLGGSCGTGTTFDYETLVGAAN